MVKYLVLIVFLIGTSHFSLAATITSNNFSGTRNWNLSTAWVGGTVPGPGDNVQYTGTGTIQIPSGFGTANLNNLTIGTGKTLTIVGSGALNISGILTINGNLIFANASFGAINAGSSTVFFVNNSLTVTGTSTINAANCSITIGSGTASLNLSASSNATFGDLTNSGAISISTTGALSVGNVTNNGSVSLSTGTLNAANFYNAGNVTHNTGTLAVSGDLTNDVSVNANFFNNSSDNIVSMTGSVVQTIIGDFDFSNLTIETGAQVVLDDAANIDVMGVLKLNGTATFDADGSSGTGVLTLNSSSDAPTGDASIGSLPSPGNFSGSVYVQRYMEIAGPNTNRIYRYISSPIQNASVSQIQASIPVTGPFTGTSVCATCITNQSMFAYDETVSGDQSVGFINFPAADNSETLASARGYAIFIRGNIDPILGNGAATWTVHGDINKGTVNYPVTYTNTGSPLDDGWNLIGNPYPSTIDWAASSGWTSPGIGPTIYYIDNVNQVVSTYNKITTLGTNGGTQYIAMGQAFYVQANGAASLSSSEAVKAAGQQTTFFRTKSLDNLMRIDLVQGTKKDETVLYFNKSTTDALNLGQDAFKMKNPAGFNLSSLSSDKYKMVVNSMGLLTDDLSKTVALDVSDAATGAYQLRFNNLESFATGMPIKLVDKFTKSETDLRTTSAYSFTVDTTQPTSFGSDRFTVVLGENLVTAVEPGNEFDIQAYPNPTKTEFSLKLIGISKPYVSVQNSVGQFISEVPLVKKSNSFEGTFDLSSRASGIYFIKIVELENGKVNVKKILKN